MEKNQVVENLRKRGALWSYAPEADLPDAVLIEETLRWGEVAELKWLFTYFGYSQVRQVWEQTLVADARIYRHNYYLALIFFDIAEPKIFLQNAQNKNSRFARLQQLTS